MSPQLDIKRRATTRASGSTPVERPALALLFAGELGEYFGEVGVYFGDGERERASSPSSSLVTPLPVGLFLVTTRSLGLVVVAFADMLLFYGLRFVVLCVNEGVFNPTH